MSLTPFGMGFETLDPLLSWSNWDFPSALGSQWPQWPQTTRRTTRRDIDWYPDMDIIDRHNDMVVLVELPGMTKKDVNVRLRGNHLFISGVTILGKDYEEGDSIMRRSEREFGKFERRLLVPSDIQTKDISCTMENGVLRVVLPRIVTSIQETGQAEQKTIEIK